MLIRFSVENYRSFRDRVELSMIAGPPLRHPEQVIPSADPACPGLVKAAILYGANASGKSNLVKAMAVAREIVLNSADVRGKLPIVPFKLDTESRGKPSRFEFEIRTQGRSFAYGFAATADQVVEEWLFDIGAGDRRIFERTGKQVRFDNIPFGNDEERQFLDFTARGTLPNRLFLAECRERNVQENIRSATALFDVLRWFESVLTVIFPDTRANVEKFVAQSTTFPEELARILRAFDTGIEEVGLQEEKSDEATIPDDIRAQLEALPPGAPGGYLVGTHTDRRRFVDRDGEGLLRVRKLMFRHGAHVDTPLFELNEESDGTRRLMDLIPVLILLGESDRVFVVDEFDRSLHPEISHSLLAAFLRRQGGGRESQLILTTHETTLLNQDFLRRDEIWLVEKGKDQSSRLIALEEYKGVPDGGDLQRDYLNGRYGGIPVLRRIW
jgi:hypothetical protein